MKYTFQKYVVRCNRCGDIPIFYKGFYSVGQHCKRCLVGKYERYIYEEKEIEV